jgi:hypothetical protein
MFVDDPAPIPDDSIRDPEPVVTCSAFIRGPGTANVEIPGVRRARDLNYKAELPTANIARDIQVSA